MYNDCDTGILLRLLPLYRKHRPRYGVDELLDRLKQHWDVNKKLSPQNLSLLKKTKEGWGSKRAREITGDLLQEYLLTRRDKGYAVATTNRNLQCLRGAFKLANAPWPKFKLPSEKSNIRKEWFDRTEVLKVIAALPPDLGDLIEWSYYCGMRKGEACLLDWSMVHGNQIEVPAECCKADEPHVIPLKGPLAAIFARRVKVRRMECSRIFHWNGDAIKEFRSTWKRATQEAGCGNLHVHDLRRSACRNLIRSGNSRTVALAVTGHQTEAIFERYNIIEVEDQEIALEKLANFRGE